jgi:hypothetical protein
MAVLTTVMTVPLLRMRRLPAAGPAGEPRRTAGNGGRKSARIPGKPGRQIEHDVASRTCLLLRKRTFARVMVRSVEQTELGSEQRLANEHSN